MTRKIVVTALIIFIFLFIVYSISYVDEEGRHNTSVKLEQPKENVLKREDILKIALSNESVKELIGGKEYTVVSVAKYGDVYYVTIMVGKKNESGRSVYAVVDPERKVVVKAYWTFRKSPPSPPEITQPASRPMPPGLKVLEFLLYYNSRYAEKIYEMFTERVKENYSLDDVKRELAFAEEFNLTLKPNEDLTKKVWLLRENETLHFKANLTISYDNTTKNVTIDFPLLYAKRSVKRNNFTYTEFHIYIDGWIFDELKEAVTKR